ncbi:MAG: hypothetical protein IT416_04800 [Candidatus Pacebacteria bacterium]|nr:hypothetical protein [Candidatus Paceibacterota bacterium]
MKQNFVSEFYFANSNLASKVEKILELIIDQTGFQVEQLVQKSSWWNSKHIGAIHYRGTYQQQPTVLKIQGVKPTTSEIAMIQAFSTQNNSQLIRPPHIYFNLPWNQRLEFEALIIEDVSREKVVNLPAKTGELSKFFELYQEYRQNCLNQPWLDKPNISLADQTAHNFTKWQKISSELQPNHPLKRETDLTLINQGLKKLCDKLVNVDWQFMHGHFSTRDLHPVGNEIVLLSNLYWSWRQPFYDAVFGFHWYQYDLANSEVSLATLLTQRSTWKKYILDNLPQTELELQLLNLAFFERALAGLNLDGLIATTDKSEALMELTREEISSFS